MHHLCTKSVHKQSLLRLNSKKMLWNCAFHPDSYDTVKVGQLINSRYGTVILILLFRRVLELIDIYTSHKPSAEHILIIVPALLERWGHYFLSERIICNTGTEHGSGGGHERLARLTIMVGGGDCVVCSPPRGWRTPAYQWRLPSWLGMLSLPCLDCRPRFLFPFLTSLTSCLGNRIKHFLLVPIN